MRGLISPRWWVNMFIQVFVTMIFIYLIKKAADKYNIPVVKQVADAV
jgi:hypothetical protein